MKKSVKLSAAAGLAAGAALFAEGYRYVFCRNYSALTGAIADRKNHEDAYYHYRDGLADYMRSRPHSEHRIVNDEGHILHGFYYPADRDGKPSGRIAFIVHGFRSEHNETAGQFYDYYTSRGIDIFCVDHASHGESEGELITYGVRESRDCLVWINYLVQSFGSDIKICLHGFSMGAATVLLMSDRCPANVRFLIEDSGYCGFESLLGGVLGKFYTPLCLANRAVAGFDPADIDVRGRVKCSRLPMLFVHGRLDPTVPFSNAEELYSICKSEKASLFVDDAKHVESFYRAQGDYSRAIDSFIERFFAEDEK